jgi:hypothetical protein
VRLTALLLKERQCSSEYFTLSAHLYLLVPAFLHLALTDGPVDKPAKLPPLKFPCRAISSGLRRTPSYYPTVGFPFIMGPLHGKKKKHLSFNMHGDVPPSLLETLYGFERSTQYLCHLALSFSQMASNLGKLLFVHARSPARFLP